MPKKKILVAPLNWGLGHATRCIPIINALLDQGFEPVLASDGAALELLMKEFPELKAYELPSYDIRYARKGYFFKSKLFLKAFKVSKTIAAERKMTLDLYTDENLSGIISDNRLGVNCKFIPSVFMTHQLNVLSGKTTYFSSKLHQHYIKKFDACWVPDAEGKPNLSGKLGHLKVPLEKPTTYLGLLSRFEKKDLALVYDYLILLSGPEPQRTYLEKLLMIEFSRTNKEILLVRGVVEDLQTKEISGNLTICNYLTSKQLEVAINESEYVVSRSGYTTLMDLTKLEKKAFFIPTPGQPEQMYLAKKLMKENIAPSCKQHEFKMEKLIEIENYKGLGNLGSSIDWQALFSLFNRK